MHKHTNIKSNTDSGAPALDSPSVTRAALLSSDSSESPEPSTLSSLLATRPLIRTFIPLFIALGLLSLAFLILTMSRTHAATDTETATASVTVPVSCTMTASPSSEHTTTMNNGTYNEVAAETTLGAACNDNGGYSIYAVGYSDNASGNTNSTSMIGPSISGTSLTIPTCTLANCTSTTPDVSRWAMKLTSISGTSTPTILGGYDGFSPIPLETTKVITYPAITATDNRSETKATYAVAISSTQPSGTYTGKVKYTIVHPNYANADGTITKGITFLTTNGSTITINGNTYANGASATLDAGTYTISGNYAEGFEFDSWSVEGGTLGSTSSDPTTLAFTGPVTVTLNSKSSCAPVGSLYCTIASMSKGDFDMSTITTALTTANSGVYKYTGSHSDNGTSDIYFYRGIIDSSFTNSSAGSSGDGTLYPNYVKLTTTVSGTTYNTCWRIFRTTASGGVKMIYNGLWTGSTCANATTSAQLSSTTYYNQGTPSSSTNYYGTQGFIAYAGYNYNNKYAYNHTSYTSAIDNNTLFTNSTASNMRTTVENWYTSTLGTATNSLLESSAGYCNDRSTYDTNNTETTTTKPYAPSTQTNFGASDRNYVKTSPSLACPYPSRDLLTTSNGLGYPVALITLDEAVLAGNGYYSKEAYAATSYLTSDSHFWSLSPWYRDWNGGVNVAYVSSGGVASIDYVYRTTGVRPVISLTSGTTPASGSGTATDPWVINP